MRSVIVLAVLSVIMAACGGSSTGTGGTAGTSGSLSAVSALTDAMTVFQEVMPMGDEETAMACACDETGRTCTCTCPGGGSVSGTVAENGFSLVYSNCKTADGVAFSGTMNGEGTSEGSTEAVITVEMDTFGSCTGVSGETTIYDINTDGETCSGTITATCNGEQVSCEQGADCSSCS